MTKTFRFVFFFRILIFTLCAIFAVIVFAATSAKAESGQAFSISPPLIELSADPGQTVTAKIKLTNVSAGPLRITAEVNDFGAKNETGEPNIIFDENQTTPYSLKEWVVAPQDFNLKSAQTQELKVPIHVPKNAEPGGHYAVVRFTGTSQGEGANDVSLAASIGSLVLLKVSGDIHYDAKIEDFYAARMNFEKTSFFEAAPLRFVTRIRNDGNIHITPTGTVTVTDLFDNEVISQRINGSPEDAKQQSGSILPQSVRRFDTVLENKRLFGRYKATLQLNYTDGRVLEQAVHFWVIPYRLMLVVLVGIVIVASGVIWGVKRYNAYIIKKAQSKNK